MKIVFIYGDPKKKLSARMTMFWTKSACYHVGFTDGVKFWDQNLIRRRRLWPLYPPERIIVVDCPANVTVDYLDYKLDTDTARYGVLDYLLFGLRPLYHLLGQSTRNARGLICSEMVADDLWNCGWGTVFASVPSPADLELAILGRIDAINNPVTTK